jgi:hypothetical protein
MLKLSLNMGRIRDFIKHNKRFHRALEVVPGFVSWNMILFPIWGSFVFPQAVAFVVLTFDIIWFYRSAMMGTTALVSYLKIESAKKYDILGELRASINFDEVYHIYMIVNVNEPLHTLARSLEAIANQDFPTQRIIVVLAMEEREKMAAEKAETLIKQFEGRIGKIYATYHPLLVGEVVGKSSNESYASKWIKKKIVDEMGLDINYVTISTSDADSLLHPKYFSYLTYLFLKSPNRYRRFWQGAVVFYNNIWRIPLPSRVLNSINTIWQMSQLSRPDRLINYSTYSTSLKMVDEVGYWDTDVIPEDYRMFFKCFFKLRGEVEVEPIFLPINADAAESTSALRTFKNQYYQQQRWAWGASDDPHFIKWWLTVGNIPFWKKTRRVFKVLTDHLFWPVNWFIVTLGTNIPILLNPKFSQTVLGQKLPSLSSSILTLCLIFLLATIYIDIKSRPKRPSKVGVMTKLTEHLGWALLPVFGFFLGALPGIDAHTRLMFGKYLEYRVTEKV